jgi:uncharacterized lipoprotein YddW (UPF0748 family)
MLERVSDTRRAELDRQAAGRNPFAWIHAFPAEWDDWRRDQVSAFVRAFSRQSRRINPNLILSAAVWSVPATRRALQTAGLAALAAQRLAGYRAADGV